VKTAAWLTLAVIMVLAAIAVLAVVTAASELDELDCIAEEICWLDFVEIRPYITA
jgi:hypothetical protein